MDEGKNNASLKKVDEGKILASLKNEDPEAFSLLFHSLHAPMLDHVTRIVNNRMDAEDIVADVIINFYDKAIYTRIDSNLFVYLLRMCTNESYNFIRSRTRREKHAEYYSNTAYPANYWLDIQNKNEEENRQAQLHLLKNAISTLPPKRQQTITMRYIDDMSYQEIASETDQDIESVRKSLYRTVKSLKKMFGRKQHD